MNKTILEVSQILKGHPVLEEKSTYKVKYLNVLEYFVKKYSKDDAWANATLQLYIRYLLGDESSYRYSVDFDLRNQVKKVSAIRFKPFKITTYRYCLIFDCVFMNAFNNKEKGEKLFAELSLAYRKKHRVKLRNIFESLYDRSTQKCEYKNIAQLKKLWNLNRQFYLDAPQKVIITANMSAGKSTLLNALIGKKVNKTQNDTCTSKLHYIVNKPFEDGFCYELDHLLELDADNQTLMEDNEDNTENEIVVGTYFRTLETLPHRLWLIDTPGVNSVLNVRHKEIAERAIISIDSDMLIYLLNGENIGTDDDRNHLLFILEHYHGRVVFVVNKVDRFRNKEDSVFETLKAVATELEEIGFTNPYVVPASSYAAYLAKMHIFENELDEEEEEEFERLSRKLKKEEYQFNTYYPDNIQESVQVNSDEDDYQLLLHSGILHLERIIYNTRR